MATQPPVNRSRMRCIVHRLCRIPRTRRSLNETLYLGSSPMNKRLACFLAIGFLSFCAPAWAELVVEITKGQADAIPIAIVPFSSPEAGSFDVAQLVSDDLARSGRFRTTDRKDMIEQPPTGAGIAFDDWRPLNHDYMVVGQVLPAGPDRFNITFELYNVLTR